MTPEHPTQENCRFHVAVLWGSMLRVSCLFRTDGPCFRAGAIYYPRWGEGCDSLAVAQVLESDTLANVQRQVARHRANIQPYPND